MMDDFPRPLPTAREILQLEALGEDRFRSCHNLDNFMGIVFGGQLLGQALAAAQYTAPAWPANSLNGYFLSAGWLDEPIEFAVTRSRDTSRFAVRHISATQGRRRVFEMICSFHQGEAQDVNHQSERPPHDLANPDTLLSLKEFASAQRARLQPHMVSMLGRDFPIELRFANPEAFFQPAPQREFWFRVPLTAPVNSAADHQALLAFISDYWLPSSIMAPHRRNNNVRGLVSLNHALWFHSPADTGDWLFYRSISPWADQGRGLARGEIFDRTGKLVASAVQEALLRRA